MKKSAVAILCAICLLLSGCTRVVRSPRDEIRLFDWAGAFDNGNASELDFDDSYASFSVKNSDFVLDIGGLCSLTDDTLVIINEDDGVSYEFAYVLHGDSVELSYHGDSVKLSKKDEK